MKTCLWYVLILLVSVSLFSFELKMIKRDSKPQSVSSTRKKKIVGKGELKFASVDYPVLFMLHPRMRSYSFERKTFIKEFSNPDDQKKALAEFNKNFNDNKIKIQELNDKIRELRKQIIREEKNNQLKARKVAANINFYNFEKSDLSVKDNGELTEQQNEIIRQELKTRKQQFESELSEIYKKKKITMEKVYSPLYCDSKEKVDLIKEILGEIKSILKQQSGNSYDYILNNCYHASFIPQLLKKYQNLEKDKTRKADELSPLNTMEKIQKIIDSSDTLGIGDVGAAFVYADLQLKYGRELPFLHSEINQYFLLNDVPDLTLEILSKLFKKYKYSEDYSEALINIYKEFKGIDREERE